MKTTIFLLALIALAGCEKAKPSAERQQRDEARSVQVQSIERISVTRIAVVDDNLAYHQQRGVYVITDAQTGKEYIGVSGIGIVEMGSHRAGKTTRQDER